MIGNNYNQLINFKTVNDDDDDGKKYLGIQH